MTERVCHAPPRLARRRLAASAGVLLLSAILYCVFVVYQRDSTLKSTAFERVAEAQAYIQGYLQERAVLPATLPEKITAQLGASADTYPHRYDMPRLRRQPGPFILLIGTRQGLILPGRDGCAAIMYEHGTVHTVWMSVAAAEAEMRQRQKLLGE